MNRLLDVIVFDVGDDPNISWIFAERITRVLARFGSFKIFFAGIFLGHTDRIKVEYVAIGLGKP